MRISATLELAALHNMSSANEVGHSPCSTCDYFGLFFLVCDVSSPVSRFPHATQSIRDKLAQAAEADKRMHRNSSGMQEMEQMENGAEAVDQLAQYDGMCLELARTFERCGSGGSHVGLIFQRISSAASDASNDSFAFQREKSRDSSSISRASPERERSSPTLAFSIRPTSGDSTGRARDLPSSPERERSSPTPAFSIHPTSGDSTGRARDLPSTVTSPDFDNFFRRALHGTAGHPYNDKLSRSLSSSFPRLHHLKSNSFENPAQLSPQIETPERSEEGKFFGDDGNDRDKTSQWRRASSDGAVLFEHSHMHGPRHSSHAANSKSTDDVPEDGTNNASVETLTSTERPKHGMESNMETINRLIQDLPEVPRHVIPHILAAPPPPCLQLECQSTPLAHDDFSQ